MKEIYIVEDDDGIREMLEFLLVSKDYSVKTFANVKSFQQNFPGSKPDLYLLDIMLPDGNGLDLCQEIKAHESSQNIPVVLMSAHANVNQLNGADDFIAKPFDINEFLLQIEKNLQKE